MITLGIVGVVCPPLGLYAIGLDAVGPETIRQSFENEMHDYKTYGAIPRWSK